MKIRLQISLERFLFWIGSILCYWWLIYAAGQITRFKAFLAVGIVEQLAERKGLDAIMKSMKALESAAWRDMLDAGPLPAPFIAIPVVMAIVLAVAPIIVRRDYRARFSGIFFLPSSILLFYLFISILNIVIASGMGWAISRGGAPRPVADFLAFAAHPLYLLAPWVIGSVPGSLSQMLYLAYVYSVFTVPNKHVEAPAKIPAVEIDQEDDWDKSVCTMEMERLTRLISARTEAPSLAHAIRGDISDYINRSSLIHGDIASGAPHYKVVLTQASVSLRRIIAEDPSRPGARDAFIFVANEMERMEYIADKEREEMTAWLSNFPPAKEKTAMSENADGVQPQ
jgi:hypothetical protein